MEGLIASVQDLAAYLYAYDGIVAFTQPKRLQRLFDFLTDLFVQVSLQTNVRNIVRMDLWP